MTGTDVLTQTMGTLQVIHEHLSSEPATVGGLALLAVSTDLWAISALKALGSKAGAVGAAVDAAYDRFLWIVIVLTVVIGCVVVFSLGRAVLEPSLPDHAEALAGGVAAVLGFLGVAILPRATKRWETRLLAGMGDPIDDGRFKSFVRGFVRFDPRRPGPGINLFFAKVLILDSIICAFVVVRIVNALLLFLGVRTWGG